MPPDAAARRGDSGQVTLDKLTVTPVSGASPEVHTYQAEDGALAGTAKVDNIDID